MNIHILEMPLDFGASRHGSDMGPSAIRLAGLRERLEALGHSAVRYGSPVQINPQECEEPPVVHKYAQKMPRRRLNMQS